MENDHFIYKIATKIYKKKKTKLKKWSRYTPRRLHFWKKYKPKTKNTTSLLKKKKKKKKPTRKPKNHN